MEHDKLTGGGGRGGGVEVVVVVEDEVVVVVEEAFFTRDSITREDPPNAHQAQHLLTPTEFTVQQVRTGSLSTSLVYREEKE